MKACKLLAFLTLCLGACQNNGTGNTPDTMQSSDGVEAVVLAVVIAGNPGNYSFDVTIASPDTGCDQYADWWEVFRPDGTLIYRRILAHSHVGEQPFSRSGSPVDVQPEDEIIVRAHMNNLGYGTQVFRGNISEGLSQQTVAVDVAAELASTEPLPGSCAF